MGSRDNKQLTGQQTTTLKKCNETESSLMGKLFEGNTTFYTYKGEPLQDNSIAIPCGQLAKVHFNDKYSIYTEKGQHIEISDSNITDPYDKEYVYKDSIDSKSTQWLSVEDSR